MLYPVICPYCNKFYSKYGISNHIRNAHNLKNIHERGNYRDNKNYVKLKNRFTPQERKQNKEIFIENILKAIEMHKNGLTLKQISADFNISYD